MGSEEQPVVRYRSTRQRFPQIRAMRISTPTVIRTRSVVMACFRLLPPCPPRRRVRCRTEVGARPTLHVGEPTRDTSHTNRQRISAMACWLLNSIRTARSWITALYRHQVAGPFMGLPERTKNPSRCTLPNMRPLACNVRMGASLRSGRWVRMAFHIRVISTSSIPRWNRSISITICSSPFRPGP